MDQQRKLRAEKLESLLEEVEEAKLQIENLKGQAERRRELMEQQRKEIEVMEQELADCVPVEQIQEKIKFCDDSLRYG